MYEPDKNDITPAHRGSENGNRYSPSGREVLTRSGVMIDVTAPKASQIRIGDIAVSLAHQERFAGHCPLRPTVAQHSLAVEWIGGMLFQHAYCDDPLEDRLRAEQSCRQEALMHDAPEFLVSDLSGAVKKLLRPSHPQFNPATQGADYVRSESRFDKLETLAERAIAERFSLTSDWGHIVHEADCLACAYEMAWGGWCADAHPPTWGRDALAVQRAYSRARDSLAAIQNAKDGGEAAFLARAEFLGIR